MYRKYLPNQLYLSSLFSKPQHPAGSGGEETLLHCLLLVFREVSLPKLPTIMPRSFLLQSTQILNQSLCTSPYCIMLHFISIVWLFREHTSLESTILAAIPCHTLISGASCMNLGIDNAHWKLKVLFLLTYHEEGLFHWLNSLHILWWAVALYRCGELHFCSRCAANTLIPTIFLNI